ncbi:anhydro-N-acetylmuramic acid kinase [Alteromonas australica]
MDGVDAVLCEISEHECTTLGAYSLPYPESLLRALHALCVPSTDEVNTLAIADRWVAEVFAQAALGLLNKYQVSAKTICAIGSHGQTLRHYPNRDIQSAVFKPQDMRGFTCQIGDPSTIAALTNINVVADFRRKDIALGGQGAPLVPAYHAAVFSDPEKYRALVNIGGIANITVLPPCQSTKPPKGFDTGPGNTLMDHWIKRHQNLPYDEHGNWARQGQVHAELLARLLEDKYFALSPPKSTGREYFNPAWLANYLSQFNAPADKRQHPRQQGDANTSPSSIPPQDVQATLLSLTAQTIADDVARELNECGANDEKSDVVICGGGVFNLALMQQLKDRLPAYRVVTSEALGIHPQHVEGAAFAWLAYAYIHDIPGNIPAVTGASAATVLGGLYK